MTLDLKLLYTILSLSILLPINLLSQSAQSIIDEVEKLYQGNSSRVKMTMIIQTEDYERSLSLEGITLGDDLANFGLVVKPI